MMSEDLPAHKGAFLGVLHERSPDFREVEAPASSGRALLEEESGLWPLELSLANVCDIITVMLGS